MACTLALAEQGFYWPGMRADMSKICTECDCVMLNRRRRRREPLHQYIVGVPMNAWRWTWLGHIPSLRRGTNTASWWGAISRNGLSASPSRIRRPRRSLGAELHRDQGTNLGSKVVLEVCRLFGIHKTRTTPYHPRSDGFIE